MTTKTKLAGATAAALALGLSQAAIAQGPSYDYLGASYAIADLGYFVDDSLDGFKLEGSVGLTQNIHLMGEWLDVSGRPFGFGADIEQYRVAIGYNHALTSSTDFVVRAGFARQKFSEDGFGSISDNGYNLEAQVRMMLNDQFELNVGSQYTDVSGDIGDRATLTSGFVYTFAQGVAVRGGVEVGADDNIIDLGVRWNFGGFRR